MGLNFGVESPLKLRDNEIIQNKFSTWIPDYLFVVLLMSSNGEPFAAVTGVVYYIL